MDCESETFSFVEFENELKTAVENLTLFDQVVSNFAHVHEKNIGEYICECILIISFSDQFSCVQRK